MRYTNPFAVFSTILPLFYANIHLFHTSLLFRLKFGVFPMTLGSAENRHPKIISREISFEVVRPVITNHNRSTSPLQTDGRTDDLAWQYRTCRPIVYDLSSSRFVAQMTVHLELSLSDGFTG